MTDTHPVPLAIPNEARQAFAAQHGLPFPNSSVVDWDVVDVDLTAVASPVVAAELRRLTTLREFKTVQDHLWARAREIEENQ